MENTTNFQPYRCVLTGGTAEITEKKSRFIATVRRTESEEEAVSFIEEMKRNTGTLPITVRRLSSAGAGS